MIEEECAGRLCERVERTRRYARQRRHEPVQIVSIEYTQSFSDFDESKVKNWLARDEDSSRMAIATG